MVLEDFLTLPVPDTVPDHAAAFVEPLAVGYHAVEKAKLQAGDLSLVVGCGPLVLP